MPLASANDMPLAVANDMPLAFANEAWIMVTGLDVYENNSKLVQVIQSGINLTAQNLSILWPTI